MMVQVYVVPDDDETVMKLNKIGICPTPYESIIDIRWYEEMKFCGCGMPDDVKDYIRSILHALKIRSESEWREDKVNEIIDHPEMSRYFVLYVLDAMGLTEHGTSVGGSWLTEAGEKFLAELSAQT